jgi:hypothetical protein
MTSWREYSAVSNWYRPSSVRKRRSAPLSTVESRYGEGMGAFPVWQPVATVRALVRNDPGVTTRTSAMRQAVWSSTNNLPCFVSGPMGATASDRADSNSASSLRPSLDPDPFTLPIRSATYLATLTLPVRVEFQLVRLTSEALTNETNEVLHRDMYTYSFPLESTPTALLQTRVGSAHSLVSVILFWAVDTFHRRCLLVLPYSLLRKTYTLVALFDSW